MDPQPFGRGGETFEPGEIGVRLIDCLANGLVVCRAAAEFEFATRVGTRVSDCTCGAVDRSSNRCEFAGFIVCPLNTPEADPGQGHERNDGGGRKGDRERVL